MSLYKLTFQTATITQQVGQLFACHNVWRVFSCAFCLCFA